MPDEKPVADVAQPPASTQEVIAPVPVKKPDPVDEFGETLGQFLSGMQAASMVSMKSMLAQFQKKADAVITKLDVGAGSDPPKKQG